MPCVCLVNTFAYRKTLKSHHPGAVKSAPTTFAPTATLAQPAAPAVPTPTPVSEDRTSFRVPHERHATESTLAPDGPVVTPSRPRVRLTRADLINAESKLGSTIFGPIPEGHRREFFHDQQNVWIWHEDWFDGQHTPHQMTVRYEVRTTGIYKKISTGKYFKLEGEELENFRRATRAYLYVIKKYLYNRSPKSFVIPEQK